MKVTKKKLSYIGVVFILTASLLLAGCGGGGGSDSGSTGAVQGSGLLTMVVSPPTIETAPDSGNDSITIGFNLEDYSADLPAFPVNITGYNVKFKRLDCEDCPVPDAFNVGSGITVKTGEPAEESITIISEQMKTRLPIAAIRNDQSNPISNQNPDVTSTEYSETIATNHNETIHPFGEADNALGVGDDAETTFGTTLSTLPVVPSTLKVYIGSELKGYDDGNGNVVGSAVLSGTINYNTGNISVTFVVPPADGDIVYVSYRYYSNTSMTSDISYTLNEIPIPGSVVVFDDSDHVIGKDDGNGNINGDNASGTIDYSTKTLDISIPDIGSISYVKVSYYTMRYNSVSMNPVDEDSVSVSIGNVTCNIVSGLLSYPCDGTFNYETGMFSNFRYYNDSATTESINVTYTVSSYNFIGGDRNLGQGDGVSKEFILQLRYPPIAPPDGDYALSIVTGDGQIATDTGSVLEGDVCEGKQSYVDHSSGVVYVCFKNPVQDGAEIYAFYRTTSMKLEATITANGYEVGGDNISISRKVTISIN